MKALPYLGKKLKTYSSTQLFTSVPQNSSKGNHNHKKRKQSLETRAVLLIFLREHEISGLAVQEIHENNENGCLQ